MNLYAMNQNLVIINNKYQIHFHILIIRIKFNLEEGL